MDEDIPRSSFSVTFLALVLVLSSLSERVVRFQFEQKSFFGESHSFMRRAKKYESLSLQIVCVRRSLGGLDQEHDELQPVVLELRGQSPQALQPVTEVRQMLMMRSVRQK